MSTEAGDAPGGSAARAAEKTAKTAVVYYSMGGNARWAAEKAAEALAADLVELIPEKAYPSSGFRKFFWGGKSAVMAETPALLPYEFRAEAYAAVVFCFPVWAGNVAPPIRTFVRDCRETLSGKRLAAIACESGAGAEKAFRKLSECLGAPLHPTLVLIDPKDKPDAANREKLRAFASQLA